MSKTFAASWIGKELTDLWRRFVASGIDFADKYRFDPFFRTEVHIVAIQLLKFAILVGIVTLGMLYAHAGTDLTTVVVGAVALVTVVLGCSLTRVALAPVRTSLDSQKQFIGNIAHELRTPISIIKTHTEVALMDRNLQVGLREMLVSTVEELDRASDIMDNLLSLAAVVRPERLAFKDVDLGDVVKRVMNLMRPLAQPKRLEMSVRMSDRRTTWGNAAALQQIVMNVVKNAVTHTPQNGRVLVTIEPVHPDHMELTVQDNGEGIARSDLFRIFEPYYRADPSRVRNESRNGLGLTIVSELVKMHEGKIMVRSTIGHGTTVTILLPAGKHMASVGAEVKRVHENASEIGVDFSHGREQHSRV